MQKVHADKVLQTHKPKIKGSQQDDDSLKNLVTLCAYCHLAEHG